MGWRGTLRSIAAAQRRMEREAVRQHREFQRQQKQFAKMLEREKAAYEVAEYENYVAILRSVQKDCGPTWNWERIAQAPPPTEPKRLNERETAAQSALNSFRPTFFDKLLKRSDRKRAALAAAVDAARKADEEAYEFGRQRHAEAMAQWTETRELAEKLLSGVPEALIEAIDAIDPFSELEELGSSVVCNVNRDGRIEAVVRVNGDSVIPTEIKSVLQSGKLSIKKMPQGQFYELYQDYVCGCVLRVARELFALLPLQYVFVTAVGEVLDTTTGHQEERPIVSAAIPRKTLLGLNFDALDASDSLRNFVHRMNFKKTKGFAPIEPISPADIAT